MPTYLDFCEDSDPDEAERKANRLKNYWQGVINRAGGQDLVSVDTDKYAVGRITKYRIKYTLHVSQDSAAFKDFVKKVQWKTR